MTKSTKRGQVLIELLVAIGAAVLIIPAIFSGIMASREGRVQQNQRLYATSLAEGAIEAIRVVREADWDNIATNGVYHPVVSGSSWILSPGAETITDFTRSLTISSVQRDASGRIVTSGGVVDPSTKKVVSEVTWGSSATSIVTLTTYLTRLTSDEYIETTVADFTAGTNTNTTVTNVSGGEVQLGAGGHGDWCNPQPSVRSYDLLRQGIPLAVTAIQGQAFVGTGANASGLSFANVEIGQQSPPQVNVLQTFDNYKTNGVFGDANYAYLATDDNQEEIVILDLHQFSDSPANTKYKKVGAFNTPDNSDGNSIFVVGSVGYMTAGNTLYSFDLSSKTGSRPKLGQTSLAGTGTKIYVVGNYAYVSISGNNSTEMQIVDITNPASMQVVGYADVDGRYGQDVYANSLGTRAYLVTSTSSSNKEFFIIDISTKSGSRPTLGSYNTNGMNPTGVRVVPGNRALITGSGAEEYQALKIDDETKPERCGGLQEDAGINGLATVIEDDDDTFAYIITNNASAEFKIIEGGPGGTLANNGSFVSKVFDAGKDTAFNRFLSTFTETSSTDIKFQIGVGDQVGGVCSANDLTFVGPDATSSTFYETGGVIPFDDNGSGYENPARCFAYKVYFDSSSLGSSSVLYDITINFSP